MLSAVRQTSFADTAAPFIRPATVLAVDTDGSLRVRTRASGVASDLRVMPAIAEARDIAPGARVLVAGADTGDAWVVGVLAAPERSTGTREVRTRAGAAARLVDTAEGECMQVLDAGGRVLFEYQVESGRCVLSAPDGDLVLRAPQGDIALESGRALRCSAAQVDVWARDPAGDASAALSLGAGTASLASRDLRIAARRGDLALEEAEYRGGSLVAMVGRAKMVLERLETVASRIFERARDVYRTVEGLHRLTAARVRTTAGESYHLKGGRTTIRADQDVRIDGRHIHLG